MAGVRPQWSIHVNSIEAAYFRTSGVLLNKLLLHCTASL